MTGAMITRRNLLLGGLAAPLIVRAASLMPVHAPRVVITSGKSLRAPPWLRCDGRLVASTQYPELFNAIGTTFGGDGLAFRLPDLRTGLVGVKYRIATRSYSPYLPAGCVHLFRKEVPA